MNDDSSKGEPHNSLECQGQLETMFVRESTPFQPFAVLGTKAKSGLSANDPIADVSLSAHCDLMKNILIIDGAMNATFSVFQAEDEEFATLFPNGEEIDVIEDVIERAGEDVATEIFARIWERPVLKSETQGVHATLIYGDPLRRDYLPPSRREIDWSDSSINEAQRRLFRSRR